jgi:hypothetical protein
MGLLAHVVGISKLNLNFLLVFGCPTISEQCGNICWIDFRVTCEDEHADE